METYDDTIYREKAIKNFKLYLLWQHYPELFFIISKFQNYAHCDKFTLNFCYDIKKLKLLLVWYIYPSSRSW